MNVMSTKFEEDIPEICGEEICVGSEETLSVKSEDEDDQALPGSPTDSGGEGEGEGDGDGDGDGDGEEEEEIEVRGTGTPGTRGRRSDSGALLDMLAEVASQKLLFSPSKRGDKRMSDGRLSATQMKGLSTNQLIQLFSNTEFDEMRKWYTYRCAFDHDCTAKFVSFASENKAKENFKDHLFTHLESLKINDSLEVSKRRMSNSRRTRKIKIRESVEEEEEGEGGEEDTVETVEIEAKTEWNDDFKLSEPDPKPAEFLFEETGPKVEVEIVGSDPTENAVVHSTTSSNSSGAVVDLSRLIAGLSEKMGVSGDHSYSTSNLVVYLVEGDTVTGPPVAHQVDVQSEGDYNVVRSAELPVIANKRSQSPGPSNAILDPSAIWELSNGEHIERDEFQMKRKPKGKAKFIGQSKIEKEKALKAIEAIRMKTGGGIDTLQCNICQPPRSFTAPTTLISHYRSHAGIKPYECRVCFAVFTRQHSLNYHMLIHTNQTRFTCQDCGRKFRHPSHFREHRRRHTGESPFECSDCLMRFKTRNTYKRHLRTRHGKVLTTSGGLIILSEDEFQMVKTAPRSNAAASTRRKRKSMPEQREEQSLDAIDEDIQALHQLEIVNSGESYDDYPKEATIDIEDMPADFLVDGSSNTYEEIVKEAVRLEREENKKAKYIKEESSIETAEETLVIETEDPLSGTGLYLATLEDGETVLVNTREDDSDDASDRVDLGFKLLEVGKVRRNSQQEPTVIVIKNESFS